MNKAPDRGNLDQSMLPGNPMPPVLWQVSDPLIAYEDALKRMEKIANGIAGGSAPETVWLLEHPPLYTAGTSARPGDLVMPDRFAVHKTGRGGEYTYHGPGQRVCYVMLDLSRRSQDVRLYVATLEAWIINTLAHFNVKAERREDRVGVWVKRPDKPPLGDSTPREDKIAAIGIRLRRWVSFHGISINLNPELEHYSGIVPCGVSDHGVTSLADLGLPVTMAGLDQALRQEFEKLFGEIMIIN